MTKLEAKKLCAIINREFKPPFVEKGMVKAKIIGDDIYIKISRRDVSFRYGTMETTGAGTRMY